MTKEIKEKKSVKKITDKTVKKSVAKKPKKETKKETVAELGAREDINIEPQQPAIAADIAEKIESPDIAAAQTKSEFNGLDGEKTEKYWEAVGRRKKAIARVRIYTRGEKIMLVNKKPYGEYFHTKEQQKTAEESLQKMKSTNRFRVSAIVKGGGLNAQAEAVRHGIARALVEFNADFRKRLRRAGFLTRDPRMKERKKFGLKSARRRPQWAKR